MSLNDQKISELLPHLHLDIKRDYDENGVSGFIDADTVTGWLSATGMNLEQLMIHLLQAAALYSVAPISQFAVGSVVHTRKAKSEEGEIGNLYFGANIEFVGQSLICSIHAEQSAINHAWLNGENSVDKIAVSAHPCGYCRQFLKEIAIYERDLRILVSADGENKTNECSVNNLSVLLPNSFGPEDLGKKSGLMGDIENGLLLQNGDDLENAAFNAANESYAPYTEAYAGVAIRNQNGQIFAGRYAENAAYNPSLLPLQSALSNAYMSAWPGIELIITEAVLVESKNSMTSQLEQTKTLLNTLAPNVALKHILV